MWHNELLESTDGAGVALLVMDTSGCSWKPAQLTTK